MKPVRVVFSDYALLRYIEARHGISVQDLRHALVVGSDAQDGMSVARVDGLILHLSGGTVVDVAPEKPNRSE